MLASQAIQPTVTIVYKYTSKLVGAASIRATKVILYEFTLSASGQTKVKTPAPTSSGQ